MMMKLRRMWIQLTSDPKRFGALCAAILVGMLLWARLIVVSRMPRMAVADDQNASVNDESTDADSSQPIHQPVSIQLDERPRRDPFVISPEHFPRPFPLTEPAPDAGKSGSKPAEEPYQIEARMTAALAVVVERIRLDAAVTGSTAVIGGKTYRLDDWIEVAGGKNETVRFRLVEVKHRSAVLETEPLAWLDGGTRRFEIQMAVLRQ